MGRILRQAVTYAVKIAFQQNAGTSVISVVNLGISGKAAGELRKSELGFFLLRHRASLTTCIFSLMRLFCFSFCISIFLLHGPARINVWYITSFILAGTLEGETGNEGRLNKS